MPKAAYMGNLVETTICFYYNYTVFVIQQILCPSCSLCFKNSQNQALVVG